jgi:hypothetical protein
MGEAKRTGKGEHVLVGHGIHWRNEDGIVERQGVIFTVVSSGAPDVGDLALIQYFEWMMGAPIYEALVPLAELAADRERWTLYPTCQHMADRWNDYEGNRTKAYWKKQEEKAQTD